MRALLGLPERQTRQFRRQALQLSRSPRLLASVQGRLVVGGPTLGEGAGTNDENMTGSFLILDAENWEVVERFVAEDPFSRAGLFSTTIVDRWKHGRHNDE